MARPARHCRSRLSRRSRVYRLRDTLGIRGLVLSALALERSALVTAPLSFADFVLRLSFFLVAPFAIVIAASLFPVGGVLADLVAALVVLFLGEAARRWSERSRWVALLLSLTMSFERYYKEHPPRPFLYYLFYPLCLPYWLVNRNARREFWMYRGYSLGAFLLVVATLVWQYYARWRPELGWREFVIPLALTLIAETLLVFCLLMPIGTTVIWYHMSQKRRRLVVLLFVGLLSTAAAIAYIYQKRDPVISFMTRERVGLRTAAAPRKAHRVMLQAARAGWRETVTRKQVEGDGKVEGVPLDKARTALGAFYKPDEASAFALWASPRKNPRILVMYFEAEKGKRPIWVAIGSDGSEIRSPSNLPPGAFNAMRRAADGTDTLDAVWPADVDLPGP